MAGGGEIETAGVLQDGANGVSSVVQENLILESSVADALEQGSLVRARRAFGADGSKLFPQRQLSVGESVKLFTSQAT